MRCDCHCSLVVTGVPSNMSSGLGKSGFGGSCSAGGKSAAIVLDDADLDKHLPSLVNGALANSGQMCFATARVLAPAARYDDVVERLVAAVGDLRVV